MKIDKIVFPVLITLVLIFIASTGVTASGISISAEVSRTAIPFEGRDTLIVEIAWEGEPFLYQIDDFPVPGLEKLQILGSSSSVSSVSDTAAAAGERTVRTYRYVLEPTDFGTAVIEPLDIKATNRLTEEVQKLQTGRLTVEIAKPVPAEGKSSSTGTTIILIAAAIVVTAAVIVFLVVRGKKKEPAVDPTVQYVTTLEEIKRETVADGKLFYSRLYRLLLQYLEKERELTLSGRTGEEVLQEAARLEDESERERLTGWLGKALQVKFRPEMPSPGDIEDIYNAVRRFFENKLQNK